MNNRENDMARLIREQERTLGEMGDSLPGMIDSLLRDAFSNDSFLRLLSGTGVFNRNYSIDPYRVLGLEKAATDDEVRKRYRELLKLLHPDTAGISGTGFLLQMVIAAYRQIGQERKAKP